MDTDPSLQPEGNPSPSGPSALVVAGQESLGPFFSAFLEKMVGCRSCVVECYGDFDLILRELSQDRYDLLIITDNTLVPEQIGGLVSRVRAASPGPAILVLSCWSAPEFLLDLAQRGADTFIQMPFEAADLIAAVKKHCHME
jgi:DNA-binding response OmpR family regulator